ncbi:hypothetical protein VPH35_044313 [Triticum aestivum]
MCHRGLASSLWHRAPNVQALSSLQKLGFPCSTPRPMPAPLRLVAVPPSTSCCCRTLPIGHCGRVVSSLSRSNGRRLHKTPSTTTVLQKFGLDKFDDAIVHLRYRDRQDRLNETPSTPMNGNANTSVAEDPCTTTVALYDYLDYERSENIYFLYFAPNENHLLHVSKV